MFTPRDLNSIQQEYFGAIADSESEVIDISQGSFVYTIARANAAVVARQDAYLSRLARASFLSTATSTDLDSWASTFGLSRQGATPSSGFVLAISKDKESVFIPADTILTDLNTGVQIAINQATTAEVNNYLETPIPVISTRLGAATRISAGTELFSPRYPTVSFTVGYTRSTSGEYCGSLEGGSDRESDADFARRVSEALNSYGSSSDTRLKVALENHPLVSKAYVSTTVPGIVNLWVDSINVLTDAQLRELQGFISPYVAGGTLVSMGYVKRTFVDVGIYARPFSYSDLDTLTQQITATVKYVFDNLAIGEALSPVVIQSALSSFARDVRVTAPLQPVIPQPFELVSHRAIDVTYATQS